MIKDASTYIPEAVGFAAEAADRLGKSAHDARDAAAEVARKAQVELTKVRAELENVAAKTETLAKENPWITAGAMLGVGILLGVAGTKLFARKPTLTEVLGVSHFPETARSSMKKQMKAFKKYF